jgi:hypothetical protein
VLYLPQENDHLAPLRTHLTQEEINLVKKDIVSTGLTNLANSIVHVSSEQDTEMLKDIYSKEVLPFIITTVWWLKRITDKKASWSTWGGRSIAHAVNCNHFFKKIINRG